MANENLGRTSLGRVAKARLGALVGAAAFSACMLVAPEVSAQAAAEDGAVSGSVKGIVGGALLGGEIVMIPMGAAGLKPWWPYLVFGGLGSVGGAVGGWAVEQADPPAEAPLYMLAGGLALVIPTLVLSLNATTREEYDSSEDPSTLEQLPPEGQPVAPGTPGGESSVTVTTSDARKVRRKRVRTPGRTPSVALFDMAAGEMRVGVPAVNVRSLYSEEEIAKFGVEQQTEVTVPLVRTAF